MKDYHKGTHEHCCKTCTHCEDATDGVISFKSKTRCVYRCTFAYAPWMSSAICSQRPRIGISMVCAKWEAIPDREEDER